LAKKEYSSKIDEVFDKICKPENLHTFTNNNQTPGRTPGTHTSRMKEKFEIPTRAANSKMSKRDKF
jgi:hypothetical protein